MHDIDRTQLEAETPEMGAAGEMTELTEFGELGQFGEIGGLSNEAAASPLDETQEMDLASQLLEASGEQELDQFLGNVFRTVGSAVGRFVRSDTGGALGGILKGAAKRALPAIGRAAGQWISPGAGGGFGADVASRAASLFGLELEGLSAEDQEFEAARQFVRFAAAAVRKAAATPPSAPASTAAQNAAKAAARTYAPGFLQPLRGRSGRLWPRSGRWVRHGRTIVLYA